MNKNKAVFGVFLVLIIIAILFIGFYFYPKYEATNELALFISNYRALARELNEEDEVDCDYSQERLDLAYNEGLSETERFERLNQSWAEEWNCVKVRDKSYFLKIEDQLYSLKKIDIEHTDYNDDCKTLISNLEKEVEIISYLTDYNNEYYQERINDTDCRLLGSDPDSDPILSEMLCDSLLEDNLEKIVRKYEDLETIEEKFTEAQNTSRRITKDLNSKLNNE